MTGHRPGVAECEVDVLVAVYVPNSVAACAVDVDRKATRLLVHPRHRYSTEQVIGSRVCRLRLGVSAHELCLFAVIEFG